MQFVAAKGVKSETETNQGPARGHDQPISARLTHHPKTFNLTRMGVNKSTGVARTGWLSEPTWLQPGMITILLFSTFLFKEYQYFAGWRMYTVVVHQLYISLMSFLMFNFWGKFGQTSVKFGPKCEWNTNFELHIQACVSYQRDYSYEVGHFGLRSSKCPDCTQKWSALTF